MELAVVVGLAYLAVAECSMKHLSGILAGRAGFEFHFRAISASSLDPHPPHWFGFDIRYVYKVILRSLELPLPPFTMSSFPLLNSSTVTISLAVAVLSLVAFSKWRGSQSLPYPPGPPPDPIIGNMRAMASGDLERVFASWGKKYGPVPNVFLISGAYLALAHVFCHDKR